MGKTMTRLPEKDVLSGTKTPRTTTGEMKLALGSLRDFLAELFGEDSSDRDKARKTMGIDLSVLASHADMQEVLLDKADRTEVQVALSAKADREELAALEVEIAKRGRPIGSIDYFAMAALPSGYLKADGTEVGRETYPDLFAAIGTVFGEGDGETTFNLPDLIGRFPQGSARPGQRVQAGLPNITGKFRAKAAAGEIPGGAFYGIGNIGGGSSDNSAPNYEEIGFDASKSNLIYGASDTVQPAALTLLACIKAFDAASNPGLVNVAGLARDVHRLTQAVDNKLDKTDNDVRLRYVCDAYRSDRGWYRKWSDGWVEQGGISPMGTISLLLPFDSTDYVAMKQWTNTGVTSVITTNTSRVSDLVCVRSKTTTSFSAVDPGFMTGQIGWYACGYAGSSDNS